jgi:hypothetical protein
VAATVEESRKERTPRLDQAGLLRGAFALEVFTCLRCGGRRRVLASLASPACRPESPPVLETFWRQNQGRTVQGGSWEPNGSMFVEEYTRISS